MNMRSKSRSAGSPKEAKGSSDPVFRTKKAKKETNAFGNEKRKPVDLDTFQDTRDEYPEEGRRKRPKKERDELSSAIKARVGKYIDDGEEGDGKKIESLFKKDFDKLRASFSSDNENMRIDQLAPAFFQASIALVMDLVPVAEVNYRKTGRESAAYALAALIGQARDLATDLRMSVDSEGQALALKSVINTTFIGVAQMLLQEKFSLQSKMDTLTNDPRIRKAMRAEIDAMVTSFTKGMQEHSNLLGERTRSFLLGEPNYLNPGAQQVEKKMKKRRKKVSNE